MTKLKYAIFVFLLSVNFIHGQDKEPGLVFGTTENVVKSPSFHLNEIKPAGGFLYRYYFNPLFDARGSLLYTPGELYLDVAGELNILQYISNSRKHKFTPYILAGAGLGYSDHFIARIPIGIGFKYSLGSFWNLNLETHTNALNPTDKVFTGFIFSKTIRWIGTKGF